MADTRRNRQSALLLFLMLGMALALAGCGKKYVPTSPDGRTRPATNAPGPAPKGTFKPYTISGKTYYPLSSGDGFEQRGIASWYGKDFHGLTTANGEIYNMHSMTCAHKTLPMNTYVRIENEDNGRVVTLRVNDRGPFVANRIVDLSYAGAKALDMVGPGTAHVHLEAVGVTGKPSRSIAKAMADGNYYVQVGSFLKRENAERMRTALGAAGYGHSRVTKTQVDDRTFWRVQVGAFRGMDQANRAHAALKRNYPRSFLIAD